MWDQSGIIDNEKLKFEVLHFLSVGHKMIMVFSGFAVWKIKTLRYKKIVRQSKNIWVEIKNAGRNVLKIM